jgi:UPF0755 protein
VFRTILKLLLLMVMIVCVLCFGSWKVLNVYMDTPMAITSPVKYQLNKGGSQHSVLAWLANNHYLEYPRAVAAYSRITGDASHVEAGEYLFEESLTPRQLLQKLRSGDVVYYPLTFVEGWNMHQLLAYLSAQSGLNHSSATKLSAFIKSLCTDHPSAEGLFFPDTYYFYHGMSDLEILGQSYSRMENILEESWRDRAGKLPYKSAYEALIMASIVEKETGVPYERGKIAGVFVRRLQKNMRLQTDPTVIYGLGENFDGNLRSRHLKDAANLYNTYRHHGLPPSPIAMPGKEAIYAALHPEPGDALYFVAKGDGSHYFSSTLEEHNRAVRQYQIDQRKKNYSSKPSRLK